jgi:hypothetical protein
MRPPDPREAPSRVPGAPSNAAARRGWLDPWSGVTILGLDWALFGGNLLSGFVLTPLLIALGAVSGFAAIFWIERRRAGRSFRHSLFAALLAAVVVGAPMPLGGTVVGGLVIALSGLPRRSS